MKKYIVILLVMAVCISGVFAANTPEPNPKNSKELQMVYTPPTGLVYAKFGFSTAVVTTGADGHLGAATDPSGDQITIKTDEITPGSLTASGGFYVYYEILASRSSTNSVSLKLSFTDFNNTKGSTFRYTKAISNKDTLGLDGKESDILNETLPESESRLYVGCHEVSIKTEDISKMSLAGSYTATASLNLLVN